MIEHSQLFTRQATLLPTSTQKPVCIIGAGGIGSMAALALVKIGAKDITLFDHDIVEDHNLPSQFFSNGQQGQNKVGALKTNIDALGFGINVTARAEVWDGETVAPIMVAAVDSMDTRKAIWGILRGRFSVELYIETRMGAEFMRIYAMRPSDPDIKEKYEATLYSDAEGVEEPCTARAIAYNTMIAGGITTALVKKYLAGERVPFETMVDLRAMGMYSV